MNPQTQNQRRLAVRFDVSSEDHALIEKIAHRAVQMAQKNYIQYGLVDAQMDLTATHANGNPLRLADLLAAKDFDFLHDILGIRRNLNRFTGKLDNGFLPRFAAPKEG